MIRPYREGVSTIPPHIRIYIRIHNIVHALRMPLLAFCTALMSPSMAPFRWRERSPGVLGLETFTTK